MTIDELLNGIENRKYAVCFNTKDEVDSFCEYAHNTFGYSYRWQKEISLAEYVKESWPAWTYIFVSDSEKNNRITFNACTSLKYFHASDTKREIVEWSNVAKTVNTDVEEETFIQILTGG